VVIFVKSALRHHIASLILRHQPVSRAARVTVDWRFVRQVLTAYKTNNCA